MRTLAHLSDLHFGRTAAHLVRAVVADVACLDPDLVVISGDLTQRATEPEYRAARAFLEQLPRPHLVVPGNHDITLFNPLRRFLQPLARWKRFIGTDLAPFHGDDELAILGLNTARSFTWKNGRVSAQQMEVLRQHLGAQGDERFKVVVTHHPFLPPAMRKGASVVGRAEETLHVLRDCDVDMILSGHHHMSQAGGTHQLYRSVQHSVLVVLAGTATSVRTRSETNAYNAITIDGPRVDIGVRTWEGARFRTRARVSYERRAGEWTPLSGAAAREVARAEGTTASEGGSA